MTVLLLVMIISILVIISVGYFLSGPSYRGPVSDHFDGKKFFTPDGDRAKGLMELFKWLRTRKQEPWIELKEVVYGTKPPARIGRGAYITFINHSTFLIQVDGINILTDPVWGKRVSPFTWSGPKRKRPPGLLFDDLPKIDIILLSHNHYDHLDLATMRKLHEKHRPMIITTLGVGALLRSKNIPGATELDWWQKLSITESLEVKAVPAQHFSSRGMFDRDATLWCGFVITRAGGNIYFAGDSGYNESLFKNIGNQCAPIDLAIIPIGAYKPQWFMSPIHCSPEEAVQIHIDVKSKQSIASHFGTFALADDGKDEPYCELQKALKTKNVPINEFIKLEEGTGKEF
ncbi:MBL fold metallo-hydrolase [soil metagenome]